nr:response regulator [uncultured Carboxylicivirga sp.]
MVDAIVDFIESNSEYVILGNAPDCKMLLKLPELNEADLVLIDIDILDDDSKESVSMLKTIRPDLKLIAISMYSEKVYWQDFYEAGFSAVVHKYMITEELLNAINRLISK